MTALISQESKNSKHQQKPNPQDWPELAPVRYIETPEQALAKEIVRKQGENAGKLLIMRSKALFAVVVAALSSVTLNAFYVIPALLRGQANIIILLFALSMVIQLSAAGYFLRAKDPLFAAQVLRLLLIINGLVLLMGFAWIGSLPLTFIIIVLMFNAYKKMEQLKYGGE